MLRSIRVAALCASLWSAAPFAGEMIGAASAIATVNGVAITQTQLEVAVQQARADGVKDNAQFRSALKNQLIARELLLQAAAKRHLANDPEVQAAAKQAQDTVMLQKYLREAVKPSAVTEADVKAQYDKIVASLGEDEYRPRMIQVEDEATAKLVLAQLKTGKSFEALAREHSKAPSAHAGGALDWVSFKLPLREGATQGVPLPLAQALLKLKPGMVSAEPIVWNARYYLLRLDEVRPTQVPQYEQFKPTLLRALQQREMERANAALVAALLKNATITQ